MEAATAEMTVVERFQLKAFVEAVMLVDEGVSTTKDVDLGMMMGAGILPSFVVAATKVQGGTGSAYFPAMTPPSIASCTTSTAPGCSDWTSSIKRYSPPSRL